MSTLKKIKIRENLEKINIEGNLDTIISDFQKYKQKYNSQEISDLEIRQEEIEDYSMYGGDYTVFYLTGTREETDEEFEKRKKHEKAVAKREETKKRKNKETKEKREITMYKKLHKKYKDKLN